MGSMLGGFITIVFIISMITYIFQEIHVMGTGQNDLIKQTLLTNSPDSENGIKNINPNELVFMPFFHLQEIVKPESLDLWSDSNRTIYDLDKINSHLEFVAFQRSRKAGVQTYRMETFRACT